MTRPILQHANDATAATEAELVERRIGDCGCPEEHYLFRGIDLIVHFEPDAVDAVLDGGDWGEAEVTIRGADWAVGRDRVFAWAAALTNGPER